NSGSLRSPGRGGKIIAQGQAAEAAALGKCHPIPNLSFFQSGLARSGAPNQIGKKRGNHLVSLTQAGARASLGLGYFLIVLTGPQPASLRSQFSRTMSVSGGSQAPMTHELELT